MLALNYFPAKKKKKKKKKLVYVSVQDKSFVSSKPPHPPPAI